jgi:hypothetical protein
MWIDALRPAAGGWDEAPRDRRLHAGIQFSCRRRLLPSTSAGIHRPGQGAGVARCPGRSWLRALRPGHHARTRPPAPAARPWHRRRSAAQDPETLGLAARHPAVARPGGAHSRQDRRGARQAAVMAQGWAFDRNVRGVVASAGRCGAVHPPQLVGSRPGGGPGRVAVAPHPLVDGRTRGRGGVRPAAGPARGVGRVERVHATRWSRGRVPPGTRYQPADERQEPSGAETNGSSAPTRPRAGTSVARECEVLNRCHPAAGDRGHDAARARRRRVLARFRHSTASENAIAK